MAEVAETRTAWWGGPLAVAGVMLLSTVPLWFTAIPPLIDLPGHLGRYHVELELARSPWLQRNWTFHWRLVGNLGVDLLVVPLAAVLGLERAVWLIALSLPPLMIWGVARISRALHGGVSPFVFAAAPFALAYPYQFGFLNYWLSTALAFHVFASWVETEAKGRTALRRAALFAPGAALVWLAHAYGWAILLVLVGAFELSRGWTADVSQWPARAVRIAGRVWPLAIPAVLMLAWRSHASGAAAAGFFDFGRKAKGLVVTLCDQNIGLDLGSLLFAGCLIYVGVRERSLRVDPALALAAGLFLVLLVLLPDMLFGSAFADVRLWPVIFIAALAAIAPATPRWRPGTLVAGAALGLFLLRMVVAAAGFAAYDRAYAEHLRALDQVPRGASLAVFTPSACDRWRAPRTDHLDSLAIVRRDAFVNSQWRIPGAELLAPRRPASAPFSADPSQMVAQDKACEPSLSDLVGKIERIPRDRFDYVWLMGFDTARLPGFPGLRRVYADERSALYVLSPLQAAAGRLEKVRN